MGTNVFLLRAWHFGLLFVCLAILTFSIDCMELRNAPESFESCFVEVSQTEVLDTNNARLCCILFHDGESEFNRKMEYNINESVPAHLSDIGFYKVNVVDNRQISADYRISGVPSLLVLKDGQEMNRILGVVSTSNLQQIFNKINP